MVGRAAFTGGDAGEGVRSTTIGSVRRGRRRSVPRRREGEQGDLTVYMRVKV